MEKWASKWLECVLRYIDFEKFSGLECVLRYIDFEKFSGGGPPDPPNERGFIPHLILPLAAFAARFKTSAFSAPPATTSLGPALGDITICSPSTENIALGLRSRAILHASGEQIVMSPSLKDNNCIVSVT